MNRLTAGHTTIGSLYNLLAEVVAECEGDEQPPKELRLIARDANGKLQYGVCLCIDEALWSDIVSACDKHGPPDSADYKFETDGAEFAFYEDGAEWLRQNLDDPLPGEGDGE